MIQNLITTIFAQQCEFNCAIYLFNHYSRTQLLNLILLAIKLIDY